MYCQHTAPWFACATGTLQSAGEDGWCLKGFGPYFLPLSGKMQFIVSAQRWAVLLRQLQGAPASGAERGWEKMPGLS